MSFNGYTISDLILKLNTIPYFKDIDRVSIFKEISFFSDVDDETLNKISDSIFFNEFKNNEIICRHGKFNESFYVILSGSVKVIIPTPTDPKYLLYSLGPGEFFGEEIIFSSEPRENSIIAENPLFTISMNAETLKLLLQISEKIKSLMNKKYIERKLENDLRRVPIFTKLNKTLFNEVLNKVELISLPEENLIFKEGDIGDAFYLIRDGEVHVYKAIHNENKLISILIEGQFFGEMALITNEPRNATVKVVHKTNLVKISRDAFLEILNKDKTMIKELYDVVDERKLNLKNVMEYSDFAIVSRKILDLNKEVNKHLDIISQCTIDTEYGSALLATIPGSRYPYVYPRDSACASRFLFKLSISSLKSGDIAFRLLGEIARFILNCQNNNGYWGQRYDINTEDKSLYKQEDNIAHGVTILCRYLIAAKKRNIEIPNLDELFNAVKRGAEFARKNYYRNEIHLFYSTTSIHESAIEKGYSIWVNYAYLLMLRLIERISIDYNISNRFPDELDLKNSFEATMDNVFSISGRYIRRLKPEGEIDFRPDITLMSPFFFGTGMDVEYFNNNDIFITSIDFIKNMLWDPELGMLQRYLPFIEDLDTHIHAGNGPWVQYTAMLAQYYFYIDKIDEGNKILSFIDKYQSKEGYLCEHLTTPDRFYEFHKLEWLSGMDYNKEFEQEILLPNISYNKIVEELNHMKNSYANVEQQCKLVGQNGYISFAAPLMWSHAEYAMALLLRSDKKIGDL